MMLQFEGPDGEVMYVKPSTILRVRPSRGIAEPANCVQLEFGGSHLFTIERFADLLVRLTAVIPLVQFTSEQGQPIWLNVAAIFAIVPVLPPNGPGTAISLGGLTSNVRETPDQVAALIP